jgi:hypothetical protein
VVAGVEAVEAYRQRLGAVAVAARLKLVGEAVGEHSRMEVEVVVGRSTRAMGVAGVILGP